MQDRRRFLGAALGLGLSPVALTMSARPADASAEAASELRRPFDAANPMRELVRFGTLAANSHNSQPWRFSIASDAIEIRPDPARRCPVVDPDDHHLFLSLGCAAENIMQAAPAAGFEPNLEILSGGDGIRVTLRPAPPRRSPMSDAILKRQSTRADYDGSSVTGDDARQLAAAAAAPGVSTLLITDRAGLDKVTEWVVRGNTAQMRDKAFVDELKSWIRFSDGQALETGDGLWARTSGNPNVPAWLGGLLFSLFVTEKGENDKYAQQVRSSSGVAILSSAANGGKEQWIEVGRACQRFGLQATALGLKYSFVNQPVEVGALRGQFASAFGLGNARPDLVLRFGRGAAMPNSLRRPLQQVIA